MNQTRSNQTDHVKNWEPEIAEITLYHGPQWGTEPEREAVLLRCVGKPSAKGHWSAHLITSERPLPPLPRKNGDLSAFLRSVREVLSQKLGRPVNPIHTGLFMERRSC